MFLFEEVLQVAQTFKLWNLNFVCLNFSLLPDGSQYKSAPPLSLLNIPPTNDTLFVSLSDEQVMNSSAVGGKAANLAILKRLIEHEKAAQVINATLEYSMWQWVFSGKQTSVVQVAEAK